MSWLTAVTGSGAAAWAAVKSMITVGFSTGTIQRIAAGAVGMFSLAKDKSSNENVAAAIADATSFYDPEVDNVEALVNSIARLTYVLEQEMKRKEAERVTEKQ